MMSVLKGAFDCLGVEPGPARLYAGSGHAFLVNIHEAICPSSPYVWHADWFIPLVRNLGLAIEDLGFFHSGSGPEERARVEAKLKAHLEAGLPCAFGNMENQLISGYDDRGFIATRPFDCVDEKICPARITFGNWQEFGDECHVNFYSFDRAEPADERTVTRRALETAVMLFRDPAGHECERYRIGRGAWDNWIAAVEEHGNSHGNWWNAMVWAECRNRAADWFAGMAARLDGEPAAAARDLSAAYREIAEGLEKVADKELAPAAKKPVLEELKSREAAAVNGVERLLGLLRASVCVSMSIPAGSSRP
jgi:hypothetical protein